MTETAKLLLPRPDLAGCIFAAIVRDTRGVALSDAERFNYFPASPLVVVTRIFEGETRLAPAGAPLENARFAAPLAAVTLSGPQSKPFASWNPGPVFAVSIGFYPDAWAALTGMSPEVISERTVSTVPDAVAEILKTCSADENIGAFWRSFESALEPLWRDARNNNQPLSWTGGQRIADWSKSLMTRSLVSGSGRSLRAAQRRLRRWTGQSSQTLSFFERIENLHALATKDGRAKPAALALEAGFSDQSHMGRSVCRATGFSPVRLNELIRTNEAFWCYRLLGERF